ncbi:Uncharacterised protein [uncultured archaeon]|nr:Uncharacterised protein [uncultured archaeon]
MHAQKQAKKPDGRGGSASDIMEPDRLAKQPLSELTRRLEGKDLREKVQAKKELVKRIGEISDVELLGYIARTSSLNDAGKALERIIKIANVSNIDKVLEEIKDISGTADCAEIRRSCGDFLDRTRYAHAE